MHDTASEPSDCRNRLFGILGGVEKWRQKNKDNFFKYLNEQSLRIRSLEK
jgi:hypothetical protein